MRALIEMAARADDEIARLHAENAALRAEVEALKVDAERYRWLREEEDTVSPYSQVVFLKGEVWANVPDGDGLDAAIDARKESANG